MQAFGTTHQSPAHLTKLSGEGQVVKGWIERGVEPATTTQHTRTRTHTHTHVDRYRGEQSRRRRDKLTKP